MFASALLASRLSSTVTLQWTKRMYVQLTRLQSIGPNSNSEVKFIIDRPCLDGLDDEIFLSNFAPIINGRILPNSEIYNKSAFEIELQIKQFPFKPPDVKIITPIYHPNVGQRGEIIVTVHAIKYLFCLQVRFVLKF